MRLIDGVAIVASIWIASTLYAQSKVPTMLGSMQVGYTLTAEGLCGNAGVSVRLADDFKWTPYTLDKLEASFLYGREQFFRYYDMDPARACNAANDLIAREGFK